ncbi:MAG TPA: D-alanyl-D-alanine carboxypeptidase/D-alanyl-D-alanine-endopeptidase [Leptolyngbyaceae cyanobacterium M33_DOE_097]|uniref:D-alanyl-D-alanine carboxypeptidase/D-alanyl-D-alanine-endopeptidase n=1 Tax=Oscillatoriales cyanobacterium SpSt-418 TaxID=2282169 RepID=A0A7C3PN42_9CYAN|nr:D-alanyl-D-alanine carboxypeptidase/D-alanyl-D-alanine-endopeptidase [Leptolyngbyaceae cyanobacterium M33_DOE_097]
MLEPERSIKSTAIAQKPAAPLCQAQLPNAIRSVINKPEYERARWGIFVETLNRSRSARRTLFGLDENKLFTPASNNKLLTTAAALRTLGPNYRIRTAVYGDLTQPNPNLWVVGQGDPSLGTEQLQQLAQQLQQKNVQQINRLIGDDRYFQGSAIHPMWDWEDVQAGYGAPINSLIFQQNAIDFTLIPQKLGQPLKLQWKDPSDAAQWRVLNQSKTVSEKEEEYLEVGRDFATPTVYVRGQLQAGAASEDVAISAPNPGDRFLQKLRRELASAGIKVQRTELATDALPTNLTEVAIVQSPPLSQLIQVTNQDSDNLYAEALLKTLGRLQNPTTDSTTAGVEVIRKVLTQGNLPPDSFAQVDGSGVARRNLVSPEALVNLLQFMNQAPEASVFRASLPVAGVSGTLKNRFRGTAAEKILQAKTGTLTGVVALSGYVTPKNYEPLVFSIVVNNTPAATRMLRQSVDDIAVLLARLDRCDTR